MAGGQSFHLRTLWMGTYKPESLELHRPGRVLLGMNKPEKPGTAKTGLEECGLPCSSLKSLELHRLGRVWRGMDKPEKPGTA